MTLSARKEEKRVLLLASGAPYNRHAVTLKQHGFWVAVADQDASKELIYGGDRFVCCSINDIDKLTLAAQHLSIDVIIALTEAGVRAASAVSERLKLPGLPRAVAEASTNKALMRLRWRAAGLSQPDFEEHFDRDSALAAVRRFGLPCVVKPTMGWASKGVSVICLDSEIEVAVDDAFAIHNGPIIIEQFIAGRLLTAEGFASGDRSEVLVLGDVVTQERSRHRVNMKLIYPAHENPTTSQARKLICEAASALGIQNSPFHCECMVDGDDVYLIEMAARGGGGHIYSTLFEPITGFSGVVRHVELLLGLEPANVDPYRRQSGACYAFFQAPPGILEHVEGIEAAKLIPGVIDFGVTLQPGQLGGDVTNDNSRHGFVCTVRSTRSEALTQADLAISKVVFKMTRDHPSN